MIVDVETHKEQEVLNITSMVNLSFKELLSSFSKKPTSGFLVIYNPHTTSALLINEGSDVTVSQDILDTMNRLIPKHNNYHHDKIDNNAHAHLKSSLFHPFLLIPFSESNLLLGTWQSIFLLEFDGPRIRKLYIDILVHYS